MGPLSGLRILEFEAIGPGPFAGMMLADMGADVLLADCAVDTGPGSIASAASTSRCVAARSRSTSSAKARRRRSP
jgi:alpha-methylacyl-CoA racemase